MTIKPTGQQHSISHGAFTAVVTEVGATLRSLQKDGVEILWTFDEDATPKGCAGQQLLPWPNRIRDGRYTFDGVEHQLDITEVPRNVALHGLAVHVPWKLVSQTDDSVVLEAIIYPQRGWDGLLKATIKHALTEEGLEVEVTAENIGDERLPYGYGAHPYVAADLSTTVLRTPFRKELLVDERLLPRAVSAVTEEHDFRDPRPLDDTTFDTAFVDPEGAWEVAVTTDRHTVTFWADDTMKWGQIFTNPTRTGIAVEPMTCGPDAFNEGPTSAGVIVLEPGESTSCTWGIRVE